MVTGARASFSSWLYRPEPKAEMTKSHLILLICSGSSNHLQQQGFIRIQAMTLVTYLITNYQGMVDGSASKPALRQDNGFMVEKTYHDIAPYLVAFGAYLMSQ